MERNEEATQFDMQLDSLYRTVEDAGFTLYLGDGALNATKDGWSDSFWVELETHAPNGKDCIRTFWLDPARDDLGLEAAIREFVEDVDVDEEAVLHFGQKGAPSLRDILDDVGWEKASLDALADTIGHPIDAPKIQFVIEYEGGSGSDDRGMEWIGEAREGSFDARDLRAKAMQEANAFAREHAGGDGDWWVAVRAAPASWDLEEVTCESAETFFTMDEDGAWFDEAFGRVVNALPRHRMHN